MDSDLLNIKSYYNSRAATYDDFFHPLQAADYIIYVNPQPGEAWLDLACRTGLVTHLATAAVESTGHVIGINIAEAMLQHARDLNGLETDGVVRSGFDIITCCSTLPIPKNIDPMLQHWAEYLKPKGKLIIDVPNTNALLNTGMFARIALRCGLDSVIPDDWAWIKTLDSLGEKFEQAGLVTEKLFVNRAYGGRIYKKDKLEGWFECTVAVLMYADFRRPSVVETVKVKWLKEFQALADEESNVHEEIKFFVGIARKV